VTGRLSPGEGTRSVLPQAVALVAALLLLLATAGVVLAARQWSVDASPTSLHEGSQTAVSVTVQNVGGSGGGDEITCVTLDIPASFTLDSASIVSIAGATSGHGWTTVTGDGSLAAHVEHTIAITPQGSPLILTQRG